MIEAMLRPLLVIAVLIAGLAADAAAAPKRAVRIETEPPGASVYLGDKERGAVGKTPLDLTLAPGEYVVIIELNGYVPAFENLVVGKGGKDPVRLQVKLAPGVSVLKVAGTAPRDARVVVDGKDRGAMPLRLEVEPGAHQVQVVVPGREPYEQWIELKGGEEHQVTVTLEGAAPVKPAVGPAGPPPPLVIARVGPHFIWRRFRYDGAPEQNNTAPFDSNARAMVRLEAEVAPWRRSRAVWRLWPLTLVLGTGITTTGTVARADEAANYNQREVDAGLRYRLGLGARAALGFEVGWSMLLFNFAGDLAYALPDVDYHAVRFGLRGEGKLGPAIGWLGVENRVVAAGGDLQGRFKAASADGFAVRVGVRAGVWKEWLEVGGEYVLTRFSWSFAPNDNNPMYVAEGGTDAFRDLGLWVGGRY